LILTKRFVASLFVAFSTLCACALTNDVYVWQRSWNEPLRQALHEHRTNFNRIVVLSAEITWKDRKPELIKVPVDFSTLAAIRTPVGLALQVGPYSGPFDRTNEIAHFLLGTAKSLMAEAKANGVDPVELQLDFDCAESKLEGYRIWVEAIKSTISPTPLTITTLPAWLHQPAFAGLIRKTDGFVLQVHSLERPRDIDSPFALCDPVAARNAAIKAASFGIPFRIALPTYGYTIAFDAKGRFVGLSAEGPAKSWPNGVQLRDVRSNPQELAALVQTWNTNPPVSLSNHPFQGIIWYRFPVANDILNLHWKTLETMMRGRSPHESLEVKPRRVEPGLVEISLENNGELDISSRFAIEVRWSRVGGTRLVAGDGLRDFELVDAQPSTVRFRTKSQSYRLPAGEKQVIGWLRLSQDREVQVEIRKEP